MEDIISGLASRGIYGGRQDTSHRSNMPRLELVDVESFTNVVDFGHQLDTNPTWLNWLRSNGPKTYRKVGKFIGSIQEFEVRKALFVDHNARTRDLGYPPAY